MKKSKIGQIFMFLLGVIVFVLGIYSLTIPAQVVATLAVIAGLAILMQGIMGILTYLRVKSQLPKSSLLLFGALIDLVFAAFILSNILATAVALSLLVGFWYLIASILRIVRSFELKKLGAPKWWLVLLTGIASTLFSLLILWKPIAGSVLITYPVALSIMGSGIMIVAEAFSNE